MEQDIEKFQALLTRSGFYDAPASIKYHYAFHGGLAAHSLQVYNNLITLTDKLDLTWGREISPYIIAMGHDLCKTNQYILENGAYIYNPLALEGHGSLSLDLLDDADIVLTPEERACIRWHMGSFDTEENWSKYTEAIHKFPNVLWTHVADMKAAYIDELKEED